MSQRPDPTKAPLFVARDTYRRRRLVDAVRALPVLGLALWMLPLLWQSAETPMPASTVLVYIFAIWFVLVGVSAALILLNRGVLRDPRGDQ